MDRSPLCNRPCGDSSLARILLKTLPQREGVISNAKLNVYKLFAQFFNPSTPNMKKNNFSYLVPIFSYKTTKKKLLKYHLGRSYP